jgi:predicted ester cyclase
MPDPMSKSPLAEPLIRIGEIAIVKENDEALDAYFTADFKFHGPGGDLTYEQLKAYFASLRATFTDLQIRRAAIIGEGRYLACRTIFSGTFANVFTVSPVGPLQPNGRHVEWEVMNLFRYNDEGRLAEEWVQYDVRSLLQKLSASRTPLGRKSGLALDTPGAD